MGWPRLRAPGHRPEWRLCVNAACFILNSSRMLLKPRSCHLCMLSRSVAIARAHLPCSTGRTWPAICCSPQSPPSALPEACAENDYAFPYQRSPPAALCLPRRPPLAVSSDSHPHAHGCRLGAGRAREGAPRFALLKVYLPDECSQTMGSRRAVLTLAPVRGTRGTRARDRIPLRERWIAVRARPWRRRGTPDGARVPSLPSKSDTGE